MEKKIIFLLVVIASSINAADKERVINAADEERIKELKAYVSGDKFDAFLKKQFEEIALKKAEAELMDAAKRVVDFAKTQNEARGGSPETPRKK